MISFPIMFTISDATAEQVAPESDIAYVGLHSLISGTKTGTMGLFPPCPAYAAASQEVSSRSRLSDWLDESSCMVVWCRPLHLSQRIFFKQFRDR